MIFVHSNQNKKQKTKQFIGLNKIHRTKYYNIERNKPSPSKAQRACRANNQHIIGFVLVIGFYRLSVRLGEFNFCNVIEENTISGIISIQKAHQKAMTSHMHSPSRTPLLFVQQRQENRKNNYKRGKQSAQ